MLILFPFFRELGHLDRSNRARYYHPPRRRLLFGRVKYRLFESAGSRNEEDLAAALHCFPRPFIPVICIPIVVIIVAIAIAIVAVVVVIAFVYRDARRRRRFLPTTSKRSRRSVWTTARSRTCKAAAAAAAAAAPPRVHLRPSLSVWLLVHFTLLPTLSTLGRLLNPRRLRLLKSREVRRVSSLREREKETERERERGRVKKRGEVRGNDMYRRRG